MADEVWIPVLPRMDRFSTTLTKGAVSAAKSAGNRAGREYSSAFGRGSGDAAQKKVKELESAQKSASSLVSKLSGDLSKARQRASRDAAAQIDAEVRLARAIEQHGEDSQQAESAQLKVNAARERATTANTNLENAENALKEAQKANTQATEELADAQRKLGGEVDKQVPFWKRWKTSLQDTGGAADHARGRLEQIGRATKTAGKAVGVGLVAVGTAVGATLAAVSGMAIKGGIDRALNIEDAQASLRGIGHDAESVDKIMESALASVKGTSFGLGDAATIAATAVAAGIKPGEDLTRTLTLTSNAAALARTGLDEMGSILNKVWTSGRVSTEELNQLGDRGIPIWTALAEQYGVTGTELRKMVSEGKVDAATFADVLENTVGDAAGEMGKTTRGMMANMSAALSRAGEGFVKGILPLFKTGIGTLTELFDEVAPMAEAAGAAVGAWLGDVALPALERLSAWVVNTGIPAMKDFAAWVGENVVPYVKDLAAQAGDFLVPVLKDLGGFLVNDVVPGLVAAGEWVVKNKDWIIPLVVAVGAGVLAYEAYAMAVLATNTVTKEFTKAGKIATGVQKVWNAVMAANPIMLVVVAVAALVAGLTYFFTQTETGKRIWGGFVNFLKDSWATVSTFFSDTWSVIKDLWSDGVAVLQSGWDSFKQFFVDSGQAISDVWTGFTGAIVDGYNKYIKPVFDGVANAGRSLLDTLQPVFTWLSEAAENWGNNFKWVGNNVIAPVAKFVGDTFMWLWNGAVKLVIGYIKLQWAIMSGLIKAAYEGVIRPALKALGDFFSWVWNGPIKSAITAIQAGWGLVGLAIRVVWETRIRPAIQAVGNFFSWVWNGPIKATVNAIQAGWNLVGSGIRWVWENGIRPVLGLVGDAFSSLYSRAVKPAMDRIGRIWENFTRGLRTIWDKFGKPALDVIMNVLKGDFPKAFERGRDLIDNVWKSVANVARKPINFVIGTVYNDGLKKLFNGVASALGLSWKLPNLKQVPAFAKGGEMKSGWKLVGEEGPELINTSPGYVYTAKETKAMLSGQTQAPEGALPVLAGRTQAEAQVPAGGLWDSIKAGASAVWDKTTDIAGAVKGWVVGKIADGVKAITNPLKAGISKMIPGGGIPRLVREGSHKMIDDAVNFIIKKDTAKAEEQAAAGGGTNAVYDGPMGRFHRPSAGPFTSMYGPRWGGWHAGVDIAGGGDTFAALDGIVQRVGWNILTGRTGIGILLNHAKDFWTYYGHNPSMGAIPVRPGDRVKGGQRIGRQGATGNVTGVHLHFETHRGAAGRDVNPMPYLRDNGGVLPPGLNWVLNNTGGNEWVFNQPQLKSLERYVQGTRPGESGPREFHYHSHNDKASAEDVVREFDRHEREQGRVRP